MSLHSDFAVDDPTAMASSLISVDWLGEDLSLYLDRCQVDTPPSLVAMTWQQVLARRSHVGSVVDFGAGDGRFGSLGQYDSYVGYEIDLSRCSRHRLPPKATIIHHCAFADVIENADLTIGNPPFVRNQDLPAGWRQRVAEQLEARSGVALSGLANAWQYFFLLSLVSLGPDGLCAIVIPYEWVSRPSAAGVRDFIRKRGWDVDVYRVADATFGGVLTTSSITIVDKRDARGRWRFFHENGDGRFTQLQSESGSPDGHLPYVSARTAAPDEARAMRGLSPGSQEIFTLTEAERARFGLLVGEDVVRCVTSLRQVPEGSRELDGSSFDRLFRSAGQKCWLLRVDEPPSPRLSAYLDSIPEMQYATSTCLERPIWWKFNMPDAPNLLVATSFKGSGPKVCVNTVGARAIGGVAGIFNINSDLRDRFLTLLAGLDIRDRIVAHANGLRKIEINQLNALLAHIA
jgi:predicted RNA methylase